MFLHVKSIKKHTLYFSDRDVGSSKFGILNMNWTTGVPAPPPQPPPNVCQRYELHKHQYSDKQQQIRESQFPQLAKLQTLKIKAEFER